MNLSCRSYKKQHFSVKVLSVNVRCPLPPPPATLCNMRRRGQPARAALGHWARLPGRTCVARTLFLSQN